MDRRQDQAPRGQVFAHQNSEQAPGGRVQGRQRLVQQPERPGAGDQPGQRKTPALAGREHPNFQIEQARQAKPIGGGQRPRDVAAAPVGLEHQFVASAPPALQTVLVADHVAVGAAGVFGGNGPLGSFERHSAGQRAQEPRRRPQQAGLARAVGADQRDDLARLDRQIEMAEQHVLAASDGQIVDFQGRDHVPPSRQAAPTWTRPPAQSMKPAAARGRRRARQAL